MSIENNSVNLEELKKSVLVFDVETSATNPDTGEDINLKTHFDEYVKYAKCKWFGCYSYKYQQYFGFEVKGNVQQIYDILNDHDILVGFNNEEFDTPILETNGLLPADKYYKQVDCMVILGSSTFYRHDGASFKNRGVLMGYKFRRNSLKAMAEEMKLDIQKGDIDYRIFFKDEYSIDEKDSIRNYLEADVMVTKQMFDKLWDYWYVFTDFLDQRNIKNLSWMRSSIASLTYKAACNVLGVDETYAEFKDTSKEEMGGRVIEPKYEEARDVWYVDFASLYPHIFAMFNLFAECDEGTQGAWHGNDYFKVRGYYNINVQHKLSKDVMEKLQQRIQIKQKLKDPEISDEEKQKLNGLQYAIKIFLNSLYGAARSPIFEKIHTTNCGWDCCWLGQQINHLTENMMNEMGFETIAGDTDSIFIVARNKHNNNEEYVKKCIDIVIEKIADNVPFPIDTFKIDIEAHIDYITWPFSDQAIVGDDGKNLKEGNRLVKVRKGKKKNYLYLDGDKIKIMGMPIIKDNATALAPKIFEEVLKPKILERRSAKFSREFIEHQITNYLSGKGALGLLVREYKVKPFNSYKNPSQIQAQISKQYFNGQDGVIHLLKNTKAGRVGKTSKYCTAQEAIEMQLGIEDLDLKKVRNELEPFVRCNNA